MNKDQINDIVQVLLRCDGYKVDHRRQYPVKTEYVYSNWTPRGSRIDGIDEVVFVGLQRFIDKFITEAWAPFFACTIEEINEVCAEYERQMLAYLGPNDVGSAHFKALWLHGKMPLRFCAFPEGSLVPIRVPMLTVENTHEDFGWLVNYFETLMSSEMWLACTSATTARRLRQHLEGFARLTGSPIEFVDWQGHDFSFRGMQGLEAAKASGLGHLLYFTGTDTLPAIDVVRRYYSGYPEGYLIGGSVPATEHSVMCAGGEDNEYDTFLRLLEMYPAGILSVVSDTWDLWNVVTSVVTRLKSEILGRDGKLVIRPDSGDPVKIICGDPDAVPGTPAFKGAVECLWDVFGGTTSPEGYRVLDSHIGCIYGDSITDERAVAIQDGLAAKGFASANIVLGVGSFNYTYVTRDTFGFAMKATWCQINGVGHDIFKDPITDNGLKKSAKGRLAVLAPRAEFREGHFTGQYDGIYLVSQATPEKEARSLLRPVWENGQWLRKESFDVIRERARA